MIGDFLRKRLHQLDMNQTDLARELTLRGHGVTRATVSHWVNGRNIPPIEDQEFRFALASSLEMNVNEMMAKIGYLINDSRRSAEALRAADIVDQLPDEAKALALDYLDLLARRYVKTDST